MKAKIYLLTPPFTQLNTPYPATAYIKGFLNTQNIRAFQSDLGIEVISLIFCKQGLEDLFAKIAQTPAEKQQLFSENAKRILALKSDYIYTIDSVMAFLQGKNPTFAHAICQENTLPQAARFAQLADLEWAFGTMGTQDKAKHLATLYLEDISDLIIECVDAHFGFSRYAERLGRSANSFDELYAVLQQEISYIDEILLELLAKRITEVAPQLVAISVPFPGNLYSAFRCAKWIKTNFPHVKTVMGGGFANTELRSLSDARVFEFFDFICLDDGEAPLLNLIEHLEQKRNIENLKRTFTLVEGRVVYFNQSECNDFKQSEVGTPDYSDLFLEKYISVIEIVNPMHRIWSDGRWNKLTMAHGCYWGKCTFCDISLDYIKIYEPIAAKILCDRMEELMAQTGQNGFHFVDEAAPPALMRALAIEILRRKLSVSWWTNIRFEKSFTRDLCILLKTSGCIAVSGGLEVASDRLLELIQKGVTVAQVAKVARNFTESGIMVHAYLMYGFPTQTAQETIDSLEMVRQMFEQGILQSGFWHQFALTAHSPVGMNPEKYNIKIKTTETGSFANNDLEYEEILKVDNEQFSFGLKKSLFNYMHGIGFELSLQHWFETKVPRTKIPKNFIENALNEIEDAFLKPSTKVIWLGKNPHIHYNVKQKKGNTLEMATLTFYDKRETFQIETNKAQGEWLCEILPLLSPQSGKVYTFQEVKKHYEEANLVDFELFWYNKAVNKLRDFGLLAIG